MSGGYCLQSLVERVHGEGLKILSLSEHASRPNSRIDFGLGDADGMKRAWTEERRGYLAAIQSLKDLLAETQRAGDMNKVGKRDKTLKRTTENIVIMATVLSHENNRS